MRLVIARNGITLKINTIAIPCVHEDRFGFLPHRKVFGRRLQLVQLLLHLARPLAGWSRAFGLYVCRRATFFICLYHDVIINICENYLIHATKSICTFISATSSAHFDLKSPLEHSLDDGRNTSMHNLRVSLSRYHISVQILIHSLAKLQSSMSSRVGQFNAPRRIILHYTRLRETL